MTSVQGGGNTPITGIVIIYSPSGELGGLMRLSSVQGPREDIMGGKPGTRHANINICSSSQLVWSAWSQRRNSRIPSHLIYKGMIL